MTKSLAAQLSKGKANKPKWCLPTSRLGANLDQNLNRRAFRVDACSHWESQRRASLSGAVQRARSVTAGATQSAALALGACGISKARIDGVSALLQRALALTLASGSGAIDCCGFDRGALRVDARGNWQSQRRASLSGTVQRACSVTACTAIGTTLALGARGISKARIDGVSALLQRALTLTLASGLGAIHCRRLNRRAL